MNKEDLTENQKSNAPNAGTSSLRLDWCSAAAARFACEKFHYSKSYPVNKTARLGVWENGIFVGAVVFSCGSSGVGSIGKSLGLRNTQVCELSRVALKSHGSSVTKIISIALRMLKRTMNGLSIVVSYADPAQSHIGGIYQGGNWVYTGRSAKDTAYIDASGKRWHSRSVSSSGVKVRCGIKKRCPRISMLKPVEVEPKYRYMIALDTEAKK